MISVEFLDGPLDGQTKVLNGFRNRFVHVAEPLHAITDLPRFATYEYEIREIRQPPKSSTMGYLSRIQKRYFFGAVHQESFNRIDPMQLLGQIDEQHDVYEFTKPCFVTEFHRWIVWARIKHDPKFLITDYELASLGFSRDDIGVKVRFPVP